MALYCDTIKFIEKKKYKNCTDTHAIKYNEI